MAAKMVSLRLPEELLDWATRYAETRGVSRTDLLIEGLRSFKDDCEAGVPEIRAAAREQSSVPRPPEQGVGVCPEREGDLGHVWADPRQDPERACVHCGLKGRLTRPVGQAVTEAPSYLAQSTSRRAEMFSTFRVPMQSGTGDPQKAYPKGMTEAQQAKAAEIVEDKKRRDAVARESGVGRPGQLRGKA